VSNVRSDIGQFALVPLWLITSGVSSNAVHVYAMLLAKFADREGKAWPSRASLGELTGMSVASIDRALAELGEKGALIKERRSRDDGGQGSNIYTLRQSRPGCQNQDTPSSETGYPPPQNQHAPPPQKRDTNHTQIEPYPLNQSVDASKAASTERRRLPKDVLTTFDQHWSKRYGRAYVFTGMHAKLAKPLVFAVRPEHLERAVREFLECDEQYYLDKKHAFEVFVKDINRFLAEDRPRRAKEPQWVGYDKSPTGFA